MGSALEPKLCKGWRVLTTFLLAAALAVGLGLLGLTHPAKAQNTITVNTSADEQNTNGQCSLREAIINANNNDQSGSTDCAPGSGADTIVFNLGSSATIPLNSELPSITDSAGLTIDGRNAKITMSGNDAVRVLEVGSGANLTLANLTVANGNGGGGFGGGVVNGGTLTVTNSTFSNNSAGNGGGIGNFGTLTVTNSTFFNNAGIIGGGIRNDGTLKATDCTFLGNTANGDGGGINNLAGSLEVTNCTFSGNSVTNDGGAIQNTNGGSLTVTNSTFSGNSASDPTGAGSGINNWQSKLEVTNSTFSDNSATSNGGGIYNYNGGATLSNTIVAKSTSGGNCNGPITDGGYNLDDGTTCGFNQPTSKSNTDPRFAGGLANNGGPTQTIALSPTSPAVDAIPPGTNGCGTDIKTDQRGVIRPQGSGCDIGAFELVQRHQKHKKHHHKGHRHKHHGVKKGGGGGITGGINNGTSQG